MLDIFFQTISLIHSQIYLFPISLLRSFFFFFKFLFLNISLFMFYTSNIIMTPLFSSIHLVLNFEKVDLQFSLLLKKKVSKRKLYKYYYIQIVGMQYSTPKKIFFRNGNEYTKNRMENGREITLINKIVFFFGKKCIRIQNVSLLSVLQTFNCNNVKSRCELITLLSTFSHFSFILITFCFDIKE